MARYKTSPFEEMILVVSKLPWWAGILLALISYPVFHAFASSPVDTLTAPGQMGNFMVKGLIRTIAMFGQFVFPLGFGIGALVSGINAIRQKKIFEKVATSPGVASLNQLSWADFERLVSEFYRRNGFQVSREGGNGPDGGIDLILRRNNEMYLVQCKQWKSYKVGVQPVREFYGVMASRGATGGFFVTSGEYTSDALDFVRGLNLELIDGRKLRDMIDIAQKPLRVSNAANNVLQLPVAPACPKCGSDMKERIARQGVHPGKEFWGCVAFPKCNGTRPVEDASVNLKPQQTGTNSHIPNLSVAKSCPECGTEMVLRQFQSGPRMGQYFYGCVPCKKGWPLENAGLKNA